MSPIRTVRAIVDSGAEESVTPPGTFPAEVLPSAMSKRGEQYSGADGSEIPNLGQSDVSFLDDEGRHTGILFQVAEITQPLVSVADLCDAGNRVVFEKGGGYIRHLASGRQIRLPRDGKTFRLEMKVTAPPEEEKDEAAEAEPAAGSATGSRRSPAFRRPE